MKKQIAILFVVLLMMSVRGNPVLDYLINELLFVDGKWKLELTTFYNDLDGWYLASKKDTVQFRDSINTSSNFVVIEQKDLLDELEIDPAGDTLLLINPEGITYQTFCFGAPGFVAAPEEGQSICTSYGMMGQIIYYLDNTPTIGEENDTLNAQGVIEGYVTDLHNNPIPNVQIGSGYDLYVTTNATGYFRLRNLAKINHLKFSKPKYETVYKSIQIYPEKVVTADTIKLSRLQEPGYYPLEIGNRWIFESTGHWSEIFAGAYLVHTWSYPLTLEVINDTSINDNRIFKIEYVTNHDIGSRYDTNYIYEAYDSSKCKVYINTYPQLSLDENEVRFYLCSQPGDSVKIWFCDFEIENERLKFIHSADSSISLFGSNAEIKILRRNDMYGNYLSKIANGFGLVEQYGFHYNNSWQSHLVLKGCIIDGIVYGDTSLIVSVEDEKNLPDKFSLFHNYPNPFNPTTRITFNIPQKSKVTLKVYDIIGNEVMELVNNELEKGMHSVNFNASNLASGVYLYTLRAGKFVESKKMLLMK